MDAPTTPSNAPTASIATVNSRESTRVAQNTSGELPLTEPQPHILSTSSLPSSPADPPTYDRKFWERMIQTGTNNNSLTVGKLMDCMGLKRDNINGIYKPGPHTFSNHNVIQLREAVDKASRNLPSDATQLADVATSPGRLASEVDELAQEFGTKIWGTEQDRDWLLEADDVSGSYPRDLRYHSREDRTLLKELLRQWIVLKAINRFYAQTAKQVKGSFKAKKDKAMQQSKPENLPTVFNEKLQHQPSAYTHAFWVQKLKGSRPDVNFRRIADDLDLKYLRQNIKGAITFENPIATELQEAINEIASRLPMTEQGLLDTAVRVEALSSDADGLLLKFGDALWSKADQNGQERVNQLVYERLQDRIQIRNYLRLWILLKAFGMYTYKRRLSTKDSAQLTIPSNELLDDTQSVHTEGVNDFPHTIDAVHQSPAVVVNAEAGIAPYSVPVEKGAHGEQNVATSHEHALSRRTVSSLAVDLTMSPTEEYGEIMTKHPEPLDKEIITTSDRSLPLAAANSCATAAQDGKLPSSGKLLVAQTEGDKLASASPLCPSGTIVDGNVSSRPVRNTRKPMVTYNEAILNGRARHTPTKYLEKHHKNVMRNASGGKKDALIATSRTKLNMTQQWDETIWRRFVATSVLGVTTPISSLGLKVRRSYGKLVIDHPVGDQLRNEVDRAASMLYARHQAEELVIAAADSSFLVEVIDHLLNEYASEIWGMDADRSLLLSAGEVETYPTNLIYENDEHRLKLWLHIRQWLFIQAFEFLRNQGDSDETREVVADAVSQLNHDEDLFKVPYRHYNPSASMHTMKQDQHSQNVDVDITQNIIEAPKTLTSFDGTTLTICSSKLGSLGKRKSSANTPDSASEQPLTIRSSKLGKRKSTAPTEHPPKKSKPTPTPLHIRNTAALTSPFLTYLNNTHTEAEEAWLLDRISHNLTLTTPYLPISLTTTFPTAMTAYLTYSRTISSVRQRATALGKDTSINPILRKMQSSRLLTELRMSRDKYVGTDVGDGIEVEDVLSRGFERLQEGEQVSEKIREGFRQKDEELLELGNGLGDGKWIFAG